MFATASTAPRSTQSRRSGENQGLSEMPYPPYAVSIVGAGPASNMPIGAMRLIGTWVPSTEVAETRRTSRPEKSSGVVVSSAVRLGAPSESDATHHERGERNVSTE